MTLDVEWFRWQDGFEKKCGKCGKIGCGNYQCRCGPFCREHCTVTDNHIPRSRQADLAEVMAE